MRKIQKFRSVNELIQLRNSGNAAFTVKISSIKIKSEMCILAVLASENELRSLQKFSLSSENLKFRSEDGKNSVS